MKGTGQHTPAGRRRRHVCTRAQLTPVVRGGAQRVAVRAFAWAQPEAVAWRPCCPRALTAASLSPLQYEYSFRTEQSAAARLPPSPTRCQQIPQS